MRVRGVNLGNWLVLEKWMNPALFEGTTAEDEYYLPRQLSPEVYEARIRIHRSEYITERDFITIASWGFDTVRIPVPYFIFGDRKPFIGCIEELDKAFNWAEKYGLKILIDLHTVPDSQNGFDNGGISGVCKWAQEPQEVEFALHVLERLAERYGSRKGLWGIEPLNEPLTVDAWDSFDIAHRYPPVDKEKAEGSAPITWEFLEQYYLEAYQRVGSYLAPDKIVLFHDGFNLKRWKPFFEKLKGGTEDGSGVDGSSGKQGRHTTSIPTGNVTNEIPAAGSKAMQGYPGVALDTHQYLMMAELAGCPQNVEGYLDYIRTHYAKDMEEVQQYVDVICGEWCLFNSLATGRDTHGGKSVLNEGEEGSGTAEVFTPAQKRQIYEPLAKASIDAWNKGSGFFYWNYKLLTDTVNTKGWIGWDAWDLGRSVDFGWFPVERK